MAKSPSAPLPSLLLFLLVRHAAAAAADATSDPYEGKSYGIVLLAHALCAALAWVAVAPAGVLVARMGREYAHWLRIHYILQFGTVLLTIAAVGLAIVAVMLRGGGFTVDAHHLLGFMLLLAVLAQAALGQYMHKKYDPERTKRPTRNVVHIILGLSTLLGGYTQVFLGLLLYATKRHVASSLFTLFWLAAAFFPVLYGTSLAFLAWERRRGDGLSWRMTLFGLGREGGSAEVRAAREKMGTAGRKRPSFRPSLPHFRHNVRFDSILQRYGSDRLAPVAEA